VSGDRDEREDVVAALAAHQQNLVPDPAPARAAVIALPPPALVALVGATGHAAVRAAELAELAAERGGGDGPLPIVDLAAPGAALPARLVQLWDAGIRALVVHGAADRLGHARAVAARWPGALALAASASLDGLHAAGPAPRRLGDRVLVPIDATADPARARDHGAAAWPIAVDPDARLGAWRGAVPPEALAGTPDAAAIRARWDAWWTAHGRPDVVRAAVLGLDPALEADLRTAATAPAAAPAPRRARLIAITGIDGAGKSSHVARLAAALRDRGARVTVLKLYRQGAFLELANQLGARTRRGAPLAAFRVSRVIKLVDSLRVFRDHLAPAIAACDAVILDRYVETHVAAAESQLGWDLAAHPALAPFPAADLRCWLELDPELALARRAARGEPASADEHAVGLRGYARVFARLAAAGGAADLRLDAGADPETNAAELAARALPLVTGTGDADRSSLAPPMAAPPGRPIVASVHVGAAADRAALGADVLALRAMLAAWCGSVADGVPEAFWLEAYAAQLVLDARTEARPRAAIALWPAAIAAMPGHADLGALAELERLLDPLIEVASYDPRPETYEPAWRGLGATAAAAVRLARAYVARLEAVAAVRGWPRLAADPDASAAAPSAPAS
jgi:dTMP kinase